MQEALQQLSHGELPYEPVLLDGRRCTVERLLGHGKSGYCYLVHDEDGAACVLKKIHHEPCDYYQFGDKLAAEVSGYQRLKALDAPMPRLMGCSPAEEWLLKAYLPGETAYDLILRDALPPACLASLQALCPRLYAAGINLDYFPTNFIPVAGQAVYIDYECNDYQPAWDFEHWGIRYWHKTPDFLAYAQAQGDLPTQKEDTHHADHS